MPQYWYYAASTFNFTQFIEVQAQYSTGIICNRHYWAGPGNKATSSNHGLVTMIENLTHVMDTFSCNFGQEQKSDMRITKMSSDQFTMVF